MQSALSNKQNEIETSISRVHGLQLIEFRSRYSFPGSILHEVGFTEPKQQQELIKNPDDTLIIISPEKFDLLDADILFIAVDPGAKELFQKY